MKSNFKCTHEISFRSFTDQKAILTQNIQTSFILITYIMKIFKDKLFYTQPTLNQNQ